MEKVWKYMFLWIIGGAAYVLLEILFRGYSHWTMFCLGGVCFLCLFQLAKHPGKPLWLMGIVGGLVITVLELASGAVINLLLGWNVWSYGGHPLNLFGQICALFTFLWILLSLPVLCLCRWLNHRLFPQQSQEKE